VFRCYRTEDGIDAIRQWFDRQDGQTKAEVVGVLQLLSATDPTQWHKTPYFKVLKKKKDDECFGLSEIILRTIENVHYRIFGFFQGTDFVMLVASKKDDDPAYQQACPLGQERKSDVQRNWKRSHYCEFP
jgi:hypothetical protein